MIAYRTTAEAFHRALEFGLADPIEIVKWADSVILAEPAPAFAFIEAASSEGNPRELLAALGEVPGEADATARRLLVFNLMLRAITRDRSAITRVTNALFSMALEGDVPSPDAETSMIEFKELLEVARLGIYGREEDVYRETVQFLTRFGEAT